MVLISNTRSTKQIAGLSLQPGLAGSLKFHQEPQNFVFCSDYMLKCYIFPHIHFARTRGLLMPFHYPRDCFVISCSFLFITLSRTYCANQATNLIVRVRHNNFAPKLLRNPTPLWRIQAISHLHLSSFWLKFSVL